MQGKRHDVSRLELELVMPATALVVIYIIFKVVQHFVETPRRRSAQKLAAHLAHQGQVAVGDTVDGAEKASTTSVSAIVPTAWG